MTSLKTAVMAVIVPLVMAGAVQVREALDLSAEPAQSPLGSAQRFAVLGASIVTSIGQTVVTGDLGVSPATAITGFPPGVVLEGTIHAADTVASQAQLDAGIANVQLKAMPCEPFNNLTGRVLGIDVLSLPPGVYCFDTSAQLTGTLVLTGAGPWIFQTGSTLTTASNAAVVVSDAGAACSGANVFWQVGSSATLGANTTFAGTVLALASVTVMSGVSVSGSVIALTAAVTLDKNAITVCEDAPVTEPNEPPVADAGPDQIVPFASLATLDGSASSDDGRLHAPSYSWVSDTGFSGNGIVATVLLPAGTHVFTLTVNDGELSADDSVEIVVTDMPGPAQSPLGSAQSFAVLGAAIVTSTGPSVLTGDLGVSPGVAITGFPPGVVVGTIHAADPAADQAKADAGFANGQLRAMQCLPTNDLTGQVLGSTVLSLPPGVYCFDTSAQLTGALALTGAGPWVFQVGTTLTTASNARIVVPDAAPGCSGSNVFWQVGSSATLGTGTEFAGTIVALASVTVMTGASVSGSLVALTEAVTLDTNAVSSVAACEATPANEPPVAAAGPDQTVSLGSLATLDGSASTDDGRIQPLGYSWVSDTGFSAGEAIADLLLPRGTHVFTLTVNDGEFSASDSVTITVTDTTAPAIAIASPVEGTSYALDQIVLASFACSDQSGMAGCAGTAGNGAPIDTSLPGSQPFCVSAADNAGNTSTECVSYSVLEPPAITVTSPVEPIYELGSSLVAEYSCAGAATCTGGAASGSALDTSTPGLKSFTITAADAAGNTTTQVVTYMVSLGTCVMPFEGLAASLRGEGTGLEHVSGMPAIWTGVETYGAGKVAQAFAVGNGNYVSLPFQQAGPFTLQAWLRTPDRLLPEFTGVLSTGGAGQTATSLQIELDGSGNYRLNAGDGERSWVLGPALDILQHVSVTFDGSTLTAYLNGQLVQSDAWTGSPGLGFHVLNLGIDRDGLNPFTGLIDEVQVFNRALSGEEVAQTFQAGASGLCNNRPPVALAATSPNPAEATGPDGAIVSLDGTGSTDPDLDTLTCTWREGATPLGTQCLLSVQLAIGSHVITLDVDDGRGRSAGTELVVDVRDTAGPVLLVPPVVLAEATSPLGASVSYTASAIDVVSGAALMTCTPVSGSLFAIGSTGVTCSATDATGNIASGGFNVVVTDTVAPEVQIAASPDALLSGSTFAVVVPANDSVGIVAVTVNGIDAARTVGTTQAGTWRATVPVTLSVAPGSAMRFDVRGLDTAGNTGTRTLLVDNDGIPGAMDRSRLAGADQSGSYSNDFSQGPTAGTLTRNGWTTKLSSAPTPGAVRTTVSGSGSIARISACTGAAKEVRLDATGETADITCASTGTITVKAISAALQLELREQLATGAWQQFNLRTGQSMSVGSPATASGQNLQAIDVDLVQVDDSGSDIVVGSYQLQPGASVDVSASPRAKGRDGQFKFKVLRGSVSVRVSGRARMLKAGEGITMVIDRVSATGPDPR